MGVYARHGVYQAIGSCKDDEGPCYDVCKTYSVPNPSTPNSHIAAMRHLQALH